MKSRALTDTEIQAMLNVLPLLRDKCLLMLGAKTGFRISELLSLCVADVLNDSVTVKRKAMKGKRQSRTVPLHAEAKRMLNEYVRMLKADSDAYLFPITRQHAWRIITNAAIDAGLSGVISCHSMRKSFGMRVYERTNFNIVAAQRALGHSSLSSTTAYLSVDEDEVNEAILA